MIVYPGSLSYDIWKDLPLPMYMNVYFWNVSNYEEIEAALPDKFIRPNMTQVGPYVFLESHLKVNNSLIYFSQS